MSYKVILTKRANQDLQEITNYYSEQSKETTQRFLRTIIKDLDFLSENPKSCPVLFSKVRRKVMTSAGSSLPLNTKAKDAGFSLQLDSTIRPSVTEA